MFCSRMKAELACTSTTEVRECTEDLENVKFLPVYRKLPVSLEDPVLYVLGWNFYGSKDGLNFPQLWRTGGNLISERYIREMVVPYVGFWEKI